MKRKVFTVIMILALTETAFGVLPCNLTYAEETEYDLNDEDVDFSGLSGIWRNENNSSEETLTMTEDGLFVYQLEENTVQGYLKYTDEYGDGNGRYDMFNRVGNWIAGFYLDSETILHMGNVDGETFYKEVNEDADTVAPENEYASDYENNSVYVLMSSKRYTGLQPLYNDSNWEGGYFYSDMTADGMTVIVNCSAKNEAVFGENEKEIRKNFAELVSDCEISDYKEKKNKKLTKKFTYPVYNLSFTTGANEDTCLWKMVYIQTDDHTYGYAYKMDIDWADEMLEEYKEAINSLELTELLNMDNVGSNTGTGTGTEYDPSAEGQSLEVFMAYFDSWYQYGDLNAMSIKLYGEGTWEIYNSRNADGSGGYLFDNGTFETSGTTALQLFSSDGSYVADVSLDGEGDLFIYPVQEGYGNIYAEAAFLRESESIAYEAQTAGDDYVENSDPGDGDYSGTPYYWYDGEGNVMYFDGLEDFYIGPDDVFYIDEDGNLCERR